MAKYGHFCRGGSEGNQPQLVDVHTRDFTEEAAVGGKRGFGGILARVSSWLSALAAVVTTCTGIRGTRAGHDLDWEQLCVLYSDNMLQVFKNTSIRDTDPPLLVLLSIHHNHLALREGQLVWVVGHTVVDGFNSLRPLLLTQKATVFSQGLPRGCSECSNTNFF